MKIKDREKTMIMKLECNNCWQEKQKKGGDIFDVETEHTFNYETKEAKCKICGHIQEIEVI